LSPEALESVLRGARSVPLWLLAPPGIGLAAGLAWLLAASRSAAALRALQRPWPRRLLTLGTFPLMLRALPGARWLLVARARRRLREEADQAGWTARGALLPAPSPGRPVLVAAPAGSDRTAALRRAAAAQLRGRRGRLPLWLRANEGDAEPDAWARRALARDAGVTDERLAALLLRRGRLLLLLDDLDALPRARHDEVARFALDAAGRQAVGMAATRPGPSLWGVARAVVLEPPADHTGRDEPDERDVEELAREWPADAREALLETLRQRALERWLRGSTRLDGATAGLPEPLRHGLVRAGWAATTPEGLELGHPPLRDLLAAEPLARDWRAALAHASLGPGHAPALRLALRRLPPHEARALLEVLAERDPELADALLDAAPAAHAGPAAQAADAGLLRRLAGAAERELLARARELSGA